MTRASRSSRISRAALVAAVTLASIATTSASARTVQPDVARPLVVAVELRGVSSVDADALRAGLATQPTKCRSILYTPVCRFTRSPVFASRTFLDPDEVRRDALRIRLFYWKRGFRDAQVTTQNRVVPGGVKVRFDITEGAPTIAEQISVTSRVRALPEREVAAALQLKRGDPLDLVALDSTRMLLQEALWERGYSDATVELDTSRVSNEANRGPVTLAIEPGKRSTVDSVRIEGNRAIGSSTIRRMMQLAPRDTYRRSALLHSQRDLYLSGLFDEVEIGAEPTADSAKTITVRVREASLNRLELNTGFSTADFLQLEVDFSRAHFLGGARRLTLRTTASNLLARQVNGAGILYDVTQGASGAERDAFLRPTWAASIEFAQPWIFGARNQLGVSIFTHRRSVPGVVTDHGAGGSVALTRQLSARSEATIGYTWEASTIEASDVYFCVSVGLCVSSAIDVVARRNPLAPLSLVMQIDRSDDPFKPTRGVRARADLEYASPPTGSAFAFARASVTSSAYHRVTRRVVAAGRVRLGLVRALASNDRSLGVSTVSGTSVIHPRKLFFSGGSQSVRGYGENQLGPRILTIDPTRLTDTTLAAPCAIAQIEIGSCNPNLAGLSAGAFQPRPLGGTALAEASVELRFPLSVAAGLSGAVFLDGAVVGSQRFSDLLGATTTVTPGFGVRFDTPAGPVRLDVGIRPRVVERLPVITQLAGTDGTLRLVTLTTPRRYDAAESRGGAFSQVLSRLTLHLAIGPAF